MTEEIIQLTKKKLEAAKKEIHNIELTNDKSRRVEWRELKKYVEWAERTIKNHEYATRRKQTCELSKQDGLPS